MPLPERLGAFPLKRRHKHSVAVRQRHDEEGDFAYLSRDPRQGVSEINLCLSRHMLEGHKDLLAGFAHPADRFFDRRVAAGVTLFVPKPFKDAFSRVPLLSWHLQILFENLLNTAFKGPDLGSVSGLALPIPRRLAVRQNLLQRSPVHTGLPQYPALALSLGKHPSPYFIPLFHIGIHTPL